MHNTDNIHSTSVNKNDEIQYAFQTTENNASKGKYSNEAFDDLP